MDLKQIFQRTIEQCDNDETLKNAIEASIKGQTVIFESDVIADVCNTSSKGPVKQYLSGRRSFEAGKQYAKEGKRVCVLNFASFVAPGGGVKKGARSQEESLCRISTLYPALMADTAAQFYKAHHDAINNGISNRRNNDDCIYTPGVKVICDDTDDCTPLAPDEWYTVDVITCAAPDQRPTAVGMFCPTDSELYDVMYKRISRIYSIAQLNNADALIMGAFGCGVFRNSPVIVASAFEAVTKNFENSFDCVEYAIKSKNSDAPNYLAFKEIKGIIER